MDDDQLQLDRHLAEFFQEAKAITLSTEESDQCRFAIETFLMENSVSLAPSMRLQEYMTHGRESSQFTEHFLADKEKRQLRKNLVGFMQQNPRMVPQEAIETAVGSFSLFRMFEVAIPRFALGLMLFIGLGAGVSFASQSTIPGDFLYPFKVNVYEPIVSKLTTNDKSQATWEAKRMQNRLVEIEKLAASSRLTKENTAQLRVKFNSHLSAAQKNLETLNANGHSDIALSIQTGLESYLDSHSSAVREIAKGEDTDASVAAAAAVQVSLPSVADQHAKKPAPKAFSLTEKVQTLLSLPAAVSSGSSVSSESTSSKGKSDSSKEKSKESSSAKQHESSKANAQSSSEAAASSAAAAQDASSSSLVPALFEDIMDAASSTMTLPDIILPKL